jgi:filamentous hemagglutinin family protein
MTVPNECTASACMPDFSTQRRAAPCRPGQLCGPFATATAIAAVMALPGYSLAGPNGGTVVGGSASISQSGSTTNINQSTNNAIINWQGFSIAPSETVNFHQPGSTSATLNRVIGNEQSVISGALNANGQVFIVNANGVLFTRGSQVNVGGLVASTLDISNQNFMAGNYSFSGSSAASITNQGRIRAGDGGYVSLLGKTVTNDGVIVAKLGTVAMASGEKITLNFAGNSLVDVTIDKGTLNALVANKRAIIADGGRVILTAKSADGILSAQVNNSGIIQARTMASLKGGSGSTRIAHKGSIKLLAQGGTVNVSGKLDASAPKGGDGGTIETSGNKVTIADSAVITTKSAYGQNGSWIIDPDGFVIAAAGGDITGAKLSSELASNNITILSTQGSGTGGNIDVNDVVTWSAGTMLTLTATNAINVNAVISNPNLNGSLTLKAGTDININAPSSLQAATVTAITKAGDVNINAPQTFASAGTWTFISGKDINVNDTVNWSAGTLTLTAGARFDDNGNVIKDAQGNVTGNGFINLNAVMTASGTASLIVNYNPNFDTSTTPINDGFGDIFNNPTESYGTPKGGITPLLDTTAGSPTFGTYIGRIDFPSANTAVNPLTINGNAYTLITSLGTPGATPGPHDLTIINANGGNGGNEFYALASDLSASGTTLSAPLITSLSSTAVLEGLGHNIDGLTMSNTVTTGAAQDIGLIDTNQGTVRDLSLTNVNISYAYGNGGALVDSNQGMITNVAASGGISVQYKPPGSSTTQLSNVGGLVGINGGGAQPAIIYGAWAKVNVNVTNVSAVGGLVGFNEAGLVNMVFPVPAVISNSSSLGTVESQLTVTAQQSFNSHTLGTGGLVGANTGGTLSHDSSSSVVTVGTSNHGQIRLVGGLAGANTLSGIGGDIFSSTATGSIVFIGGNVGNVGGLTGSNSGGLIDNSFSSTAIDAGLGTRAAGFVGSNSGTITNSTFDTGSSGYDANHGTQNGTPSGLTTGTGPSPGQGPAPSNAAQAAAAKAQAQALTQQATAQQVAVAQAQAAAAAARLASAQAGGRAANVASTAANALSGSPPSGATSSAGTSAVLNPVTAALNANLNAISTGVQADDQRVRRGVVVTAATTPARRTNFRSTIRSIEINGRRINVPNAPGPNR